MKLAGPIWDLEAVESGVADNPFWTHTESRLHFGSTSGSGRAETALQVAMRVLETVYFHT